MQRDRDVQLDYELQGDRDSDYMRIFSGIGICPNKKICSGTAVLMGYGFSLG